jgi:hypothetical protein
VPTISTISALVEAVWDALCDCPGMAFIVQKMNEIRATKAAILRIVQHRRQLYGGRVNLLSINHDNAH